MLREVSDTAVWQKTPRSPEELRRETEALQLLGPAVVRLIAVENGSLVLERVDPGTTALSVPDDTATAAIAEALLALWVAPPDDCRLPTIEDECQALYDRDAVAPLPAELVRAAREALDSLLSDAPEPCVLHGDLHHENLLWSDARGWVAIDPHGVVGDPAYDVGPLLINPWTPAAAALLPTRLPILSEKLDLPLLRLMRWGLVRAVLAEAWKVQGSGSPNGSALRVAAALVPGDSPSG